MPETASSLLAAWSSFYTMTGSSAAALTGLMFVVISLVSGRTRRPDAHEGIASFSTPTVMNFGTVLLISAVLIAPWRVLIYPSAITAIIALYGIVHIVRAMFRARRLTAYTADVEDWVWYTILPLVAYVAITGGAVALAGAPISALFIVAGSLVLLIFIGIRNAWDVVTYIAVELPPS